GACPARDHGSDDLRARTLGKHGELVGMRLVIGLAQIDAYYQCLHWQPINETPAGAPRSAGFQEMDSSELRGGLVVHLKSNRTSRNDGGNGVLVDHLCDGIAQQYNVLIERFDLPLQFDSVDEVDGNGHVILT